jgi:phosphatidate cytidylyltransferase
MIWNIYFVILIYFILGFIAFYFINRRKGRESARMNRIKYASYFVIIHILFFSIVFLPVIFKVIAAGIIAIGFYELHRVYKGSGYRYTSLFLISALIFALFGAGFLRFSGLDFRLILFSFLILSIFDSFSQITGQLWGRRLLFPKISPQKTVEGLLGGAVVAVVSSWLIGDLIDDSGFYPVFLAFGIVVFSFLGDMATSVYKRKYEVKDFSALIPGHGGFLDRFDSLIAGGAFVALSVFTLRLISQ